MIISLVGPHGSGKTMVADLLSSDPFFSKFDLGPMIRSLHSVSSGSHLPLGNWIEIEERHHGPDFTNIVLLQEVHRLIAESPGMASGHQVFVGSRSLRGLRYIQENLTGVESTQSHTIYFDAPFEVLRQRYEEREQKSVTRAQFQKLLDRDIDMGLPHLKAVADTLITNVGLTPALLLARVLMEIERIAVAA